MLSSVVHFIASWMATFLVHSTVLILLVLFITKLLSIGDQAMERLWKVVLVGAVVSPTVQTVVPLPDISSMISSNIVRTADSPTQITPSTDPRGRPVAIRWTPDSPDVVPPRRERSILPYLLFSSCLVGQCLLLVFSMGRYRRMLSAIGPRTEVTTGHVASIFDGLCNDSGVRRRVRLTRGPGCPAPMVLGRREICVPDRFFHGELSSAQQAAVLGHELAHIVRRDPEWQRAGFVLTHLFFFQPLLSLAIKRIAAIAENLSDDWSVLKVGEPLALATSLTTIAGWSQDKADHSRVSLLALTDGQGTLVGRVNRLSAERRPVEGATRSRYWLTAALLPMLVAGVVPSFELAGLRVSIPDDSDWAWSQAFHASDTIEVKNVTGDIQLRVFDSDSVLVMASLAGMDWQQARFEVVKKGNRVTICTILPPSAGSPPNRCDPGPWSRHGSTADIRADITVYLPRYASALLNTMTGDVVIDGLPRGLVVDVNTGKVDAFFEDHGWAGSLELYNTTGDLNIHYPDKATFSYDANSEMGSLSLYSDPPSAQTVSSASGRVGSSNRPGGSIWVRSQYGNIRLHSMH